MSTATRPFPRIPEFPLAPTALQRWIRFSAKGGIGKARAKVDRVSEDGDKDLMMLEGDEIIVLMDLKDQTYLGHCEGVVGLFRHGDVEFLQAQLKKPVMTPRSSSSKHATPGHSTSTSQGAPKSLLPKSSAPSDSAQHSQSERTDQTGMSHDEDVSEASRDGKREFEQNRVGNSQFGTHQTSEIEGLGIKVKYAPSHQDGEDRVLAAPATQNDVDASTTRSPDLAGAFSALSHSPLEETFSPAHSSDSHVVPPLLTSPHSEDTSHSAPTTPRTPAYDSVALMFTKDLPPTPLVDQTTRLRTYFADESEPQLDALMGVDHRRPYRGGQIPFPANTASAFSSSGSLPSSTIDSSAVSLASLVRGRLPKSSDSTTASGASHVSEGSGFGSASSSVPGTPGDDPTLAFIFDSYRYSIVPNAIVPGGAASPGSTMRHDQAQEPEPFGGGRDNGVRNRSKSLGQLGAASEIRERMQRGEAASALPPHISPTRTRTANPPSSQRQTSRDADTFPTSSTLDSLVSFESSETESQPSMRSTVHGTPSSLGERHGQSSRSRASVSPEQPRSEVRSRKMSNIAGLKALDLSPSAIAATSAVWRSHNDASPVTQIAWNEAQSAKANGASDLFVNSPASSESHDGHLDNLSLPAVGASDQYLRRLPASEDAYAPSPSSISYQSSASAEDVSGSFDRSTEDIPDSSRVVPNKLRKKPSFRLRKSQSSSLRQADECLALASSGGLPPRPALPTRLGSDPFYAPAPPSPPVRQLARKTSISSKFSRKSSDKEGEKERKDKKVDYGIGISNKDFEEETVQIGSNAFEIVKPFVALLSQDEQDGPDATREEHSQTETYLTPSIRTDLSTPSPHADHRFPPNQSHFSPPTPLSAEGDGKSVEDHRAKELKWIQALSSGVSAAQVRKSKKMRSLVQSGVPSSVRGKVWAFLAEADKEKQAGLFEGLCSLGRGRRAAVIDQDVESLLIDNAQFAHGSAGREDLYAVLNAFSHFDPQLGHYPGLSNLVALLLTQMPAEESFYTLVSLVKNYGFRQFFAVGREELRLEMIAFTFLLEMVEPKIARRFREFEIGTTEYLFSWLSSFFLSILPLPTVLRVVDVFLLDPKTRYRAPLTILHLAQFPDLDQFPSRDSVLNYLLAPPPAAFSPAILIPAISNYKLSDDKVHKAIKRAAQEMLAPRN
ncbi:hypothetical protein JCM3766R1_001069 [Sporobolomyces carnicolor]